MEDTEQCLERAQKKWEMAKLLKDEDEENE
jgi:hypothetical protein